jgi:acyl dehydratase
MISIRRASLIVFACSLAGCAYEGPAANGSAVRTLMASQILPAQPHEDAGNDGDAAAAAYANYKQSFVTPVTQGDSPLVGGKK